MTMTSYGRIGRYLLRTTGSGPKPEGPGTCPGLSGSGTPILELGLESRRVRPGSRIKLWPRRLPAPRSFLSGESSNGVLSTETLRRGCDSSPGTAERAVVAPRRRRSRARSGTGPRACTRGRWHRCRSDTAPCAAGRPRGRRRRRRRCRAASGTLAIVNDTTASDGNTNSIPSYGDRVRPAAAVPGPARPRRRQRRRRSCLPPTRDRARGQPGRTAPRRPAPDTR